MGFLLWIEFIDYDYEPTGFNGVYFIDISDWNQTTILWIEGDVQPKDFNRVTIIDGSSERESIVWAYWVETDLWLDVSRISCAFRDSQNDTYQYGFPLGKCHIDCQQSEKIIDPMLTPSTLLK